MELLHRILAEGGSLPTWHPLRTGDPESVVRAGVSVRGRVVAEEGVHEDDYESFIVDWVSAEYPAGQRIHAVEIE